jgi:predicted  nucleic acid-binding Zn-ribbon protein
MHGRELPAAIKLLTRELGEHRKERQTVLDWIKSQCGLATKHDLEKLGELIMSKISEFSDKQNAFNDRVDAAVTGLQGDIKALNDKITELQNSPGEITPEDQAALYALQARGQTIADKIEALDALTPPETPTP